MQRYTVYFIWKLLYIYRVVPPPIIMSANNCIYLVFVTRRYCVAVTVRDCDGSGRQPKTCVKPEAAITVFELLIMGGVSPETCSAIKKHWNTKF